jgi:hypothetical protein
MSSSLAQSKSFGVAAGASFSAGCMKRAASERHHTLGYVGNVGVRRETLAGTTNGFWRVSLKDFAVRIVQMAGCIARIEAS